MLTLVCLVAHADSAQPVPRRYLPLIETHMANLTSRGLDVYGPQHTGMWMAVIDTRTGRHPTFAQTPKRVYRQIGAPRGSSLYWDQPMIAVACRLSALTGKREYRASAEEYVDSFLATCVDDNGVFIWGNHCYYDAFEDRPFPFSGGYHELRPLVPLWDFLWEQDPRSCERYIRSIVPRHIHDVETGGFNRHDNGRREHAFVESGGVLVETLAWLYSKTNDQELLDLAKRIAKYSFNHRGLNTGLIINNPDGGRWDSKVCTTEVALWANCLLRSSELTSNYEFTQMAADAVSAYLKHGYDPATGNYFGQLDVETGKHVIPEKPGYWPREFSNAWNPDQWPTHDYPMEMAEVCVTLYRETGDELFRQGTVRWVNVIRRSSLSEREVSYAGQYGRCILFLIHAADALKQPELTTEARQLADEAVGRLYENGWFQGYADSHLYEAVDGVGELLLALMEVDIHKR